MESIATLDILFIYLLFIGLIFSIIFLINLKFEIFTYIVRKKITFISSSFLGAFILSLYVQIDENIIRYNYWKDKIASKELSYNLENLSKKNIEINNSVEYIKFFYIPSQNESVICHKKFLSKNYEYEFIDIFVNSIRVLQWSDIDDDCFKTTNKVLLDLSYILVIGGWSFTILLLLSRQLSLLIPRKNHSVFIGLNRYSRQLIDELIPDKNIIKVYNTSESNKYVDELEKSGVILVFGKLEYTIKNEIVDAKEIFIKNDTDSESMNNLSLIINKLKKEKFKRTKKKTKIYIEIKNRDNKVFFDKKGIYDLVGSNYEIIVFSINELIAQRMLKKRPLVSNLDKNNLNYNENLEILIVGFNDLSEEILYNILKLAHFDLSKYVNIKIVDDDWEKLEIKYKRIIDKGLDPWKDGSERFWKLQFLPYSELYRDETFIIEDKFRFNRVILCDKKLNNSMDILNYINNNYSTKLIDKNTIVQLFNEHININQSIDNDKKNTYKNFFTFGDIETIVTYENITNNRLYQISKATNDYKEIDKSKKWENTDSFTRESNFTEKLHMYVKLDICNLRIKELEAKNTSKDINTLMNKYINNTKKHFEILMKDDEYIEEFIKLNYIFENFTKRFDDSKFDLFDFKNLKKEKLNDIYNKLNSVENNFEKFSQEYITKYKPIKIEELFKIINWENKPIQVKRKKLKLFLNNFKVLNQNEYYGDLKKCFEDFDKNYNEDIIDLNANDFGIIKKSYGKEIEKLNLKTRQDFIKFYEGISCLNKDLQKAFEKLGEYGNFEIKLNNKQRSVIDKVYKKLSDIEVPEAFIKLEEKKVTLNICMLLSSIEMYNKIKSNDIKNIEKYIDQLAKLEHKRWNVYHILNGWKRRRIKEKDQIKKEHYDLCDWKTLEKEDSYVVKYDYKNIYQIPFVVYCLDGKIEGIKDKNDL